MSLSCQISCFPPDCIKENIRQLALGELPVQKKKSDKNVYFINLLYRTFQGHKAFIYISSKVIIFFPHWHYTYWFFLCFFVFPQPLETAEVPLADRAFHIHPRSVRLLHEQLWRAKDVPIPEQCPVAVLQLPFQTLYKMHRSDYLFDNSKPGRLWGSLVLSPMHMDKGRALHVQGLQAL